MFRNRYFWLLISLFFVLKTEAKVTLTSIWGDNMVLQQQAEVTFRGKATPGKRVYASASWNHRKIYADCDRNGQWTLALPTPGSRRTIYHYFFGRRRADLKKYPDR
ncbi:hypothetical protein NXX42_16460 [Bacteroides thetaiotaomicron]|nr:hypothetical protein [Bacteroides thetaiotaomicron]